MLSELCLAPLHFALLDFSKGHYTRDESAAPEITDANHLSVQIFLGLFNSKLFEI